MRRFRQFFQNLKIRRKIQLFSAVLVLLLCVVFVWFYSLLAFQTVKQRTRETAEQNLGEIETYILAVDRRISAGLNHLGTSISLQKVLEQIRSGAGTEQVWTVDALLWDLQNASQLQGLEIFTPEGTFVAGTLEEQEPAQPALEIFPQLREHPETNVWYDDGENTNARTDHISVYRAVCGRDRQVVAVVRARLDVSALSDIYNYVGFNLSSELYLFTGRGNLLLPKEAEPAVLRVGRDSFEDYQNGSWQEEKTYTNRDETYLVQSLPLETHHLYVVSIAGYSQMKEDVQTLQTTILLLGLSCILVLVFYLSLMGKAISRPIVELSGKMERVREGELSLRIGSENQDEIGILSRNFDRMLDRIEELMQEVAAAEKRRHELELISLQTQITPHFLYNSLDSVSALAQMGDMEGAFEMSKALGSFYRGVLSDGRSVIRIREELRMTDSYLRVQHQRYRDDFTYHIDVDPALLEASIVKLTLQPLVENAIYHGIRKVRRPGRIEISGRLEEGTVILSVWDNGQGMQRDEGIPENAEKGDLILHRKGYGMYNADQRIKLYFGGGYGLHVESQPGEWTRVDVYLPLQPYGEYQHDFGTDR